MITDRFRTSEEVAGIDATTHWVEWEEFRGAGRLVVRHESGGFVGEVPSAEPITSRTDSWEVANRVAAALGMDAPEWVEHDGAVIHFGAAVLA